MPENVESDVMPALSLSGSGWGASPIIQMAFRSSEVPSSSKGRDLTGALALYDEARIAVVSIGQHC